MQRCDDDVIRFAGVGPIFDSFGLAQCSPERRSRNLIGAPHIMLLYTVLCVALIRIGHMPCLFMNPDTAVSGFFFYAARGAEGDGRRRLHYGNFTFQNAIYT